MYVYMFLCVHQLLLWIYAILQEEKKVNLTSNN